MIYLALQSDSMDGCIIPWSLGDCEDAHEAESKAFSRGIEFFTIIDEYDAKAIIRELKEAEGEQ